MEQNIIIADNLNDIGIIAKTICTNFQNEMCNFRHFFAVRLPALKYHLKGF